MADDTVSDDTSVFVDSMKISNTKRKTSSDLNILKKWKVKQNENRSLEEIPTAELDKVLARFFMSVKKDAGSAYEPTTVKSFQSSLSRFLLEKRHINILLDREFHHSREVLSAKMKELKSMGLGTKKRKADPFTADEINTLYEKDFLGRGNTKALVRTVWMNNTMHFGLRSREEDSTLKFGDIKMKMTSDGVQYLEHTERVTKTRDGTTKDSRVFHAKMFADPENPRCPVETFKNYLRHRPADMVQDDSPFYLGCARQIKDNVWYSRQPLGNFVKEMCDEAGIQGRHTNHSARKTTVTALVHEDIPDTRIMQLSGHKNVQSINTYSSASMEQQKQMSNILSKVGTGNVTNSDINKVENVELFHDINNNDITAKEMPADDDA